MGRIFNSTLNTPHLTLPNLLNFFPQNTAFHPHQRTVIFSLVTFLISVLRVRKN
ncbi:MAG: hypothetical protein KME17_13940 [Cyanosarcina radialis HA8281-LM2]|nr:hypothetical protein [Cyanosarcina radialis HA8281-LM2]